MKKIIFNIAVLTLLISSYGKAQSNALLASNSEMVSFETKLVSESTNSASKKSTPKYYTVPESKVGFQMDPVSNLINIDINNEVIYTKAELLSSETNKTVRTTNLDSDNKSVDLNNIDSGSYYLILSNEKGDVFSEKLIIF